MYTLFASVFLLTVAAGDGGVTWHPSIYSGIRFRDSELTGALHAANRHGHEVRLEEPIYPTGGMELFVKFYLYTRKNAESYQELKVGDVEGLSGSNFNPSFPTVIVIHGYMSDIDSGIIQDTKNSFIQEREVNVIGVDWSLIATNPIYLIPAAETGNVGEYVGTFINFLATNGSLKLDDVHLIGHSLGAHVAGAAGASVAGGKVARISGLDPAKPGFENAGPEGRIDVTDAEFVDCIHTTCGGLGLEGPLCTADFYPNGGLNPQPGCPWIDFGSCSHSRSHKYFSESVHPDHKFPAFFCDHIPEDGPVNCTETQFFMGEPANKQMKGIYYTTTNDGYPYAPLVGDR